MEVILSIQYGPREAILGFVGAEPEKKTDGSWKMTELRDNAARFPKDQAEEAIARYLEYIKTYSCCMDTSLMRIVPFDI